MLGGREDWIGRLLELRPRTREESRALSFGLRVARLDEPAELVEDGCIEPRARDELLDRERPESADKLFDQASGCVPVFALYGAVDADFALEFALEQPTVE